MNGVGRSLFGHDRRQMGNNRMHKVFISYHHRNDQAYKNELINFGRSFGVFIDRSVDTGDISENLDDQTIREKIRDDYLRDSTVTIVLVGVETKLRKHIDWEIYSSMFDGVRNKQSGILVINLPSTKCTSYNAAHGDKEKRVIYPEQRSWITISERAEYERRYPYLPDRVIDNLLAPKAYISVVPWERLTADRLKFLVEASFSRRSDCEYDLRKPMRRRDTFGRVQVGNIGR